MQFALMALAALAYTLGGILMKHADGLRHLTLAGGFLVLFAIGAVLQSLAMRNSDLGTTYVIVLGLEAALALTFGVFLFAEPITITKFVAVLLIVSGISLLRTL